MSLIRPMAVAVALSAALLGVSGRVAGSDDAPAARSSASSLPAPVPVSTPSEVAPVLARFGLQGMDAPAIINHLDALAGDDRPADLKASVRPGELVLTSAGKEVALAIPADRFYLSLAPYLDHTHECFYHSLTTCTGELGGKRVSVRITDSTHGTVLVDETRTSYANGFVGYWLPRDIKGTVRVTYGDHTGEVAFATDAEAATCLTTLHLT